MSSKIISYTLPDSYLMDSPVSKLIVWQPESPIIVIGQSNSPENYVLEKKAAQDGIKIIKRPTGGEAVVLTPKMFIVSLILRNNKLPKSLVFFQKINNLLMTALTEAGLKNGEYKGISDIAVKEKKIMGSSIYRKPGMLFYHAVFNYEESPDYIASYLKHPAREPDYRKGRSHSEFVTTIIDSGISLSMNNLMIKLEKKLQPILNG